MRARSSAFLLVGSLFLGSCASSHNMADGGAGFWNGGYKVTAVKEGVYRIRAQTNVAPFENPGTAREMWAEHAEVACGGPYTEKNVTEYSYEPIPPTWIGLKYITSVKEGLATCVN